MLPKVVIFLGSFLAFLLEPMAGRALLPHFGSSTSTWITCLCAFQVFLVAGYAYGAWMSAGGRRNPLKRIVHVALLLAASAYTAVISPRLVAAFAGRGAGGVCLTLAATVLPAFLLLSANATIVQSLRGGEYRLYAVSSAGSLAGLLAYALFVEPLVGMQDQWRLVAVGLAGYAVLLGVLGANGEEAAPSAVGAHDDAPGRILPACAPLLWLGLSFVGCGTLTAATAHLTTDIAGLPIVWSLLLALYLLSWIVAFSPFCERHLPGFALAGSAATVVAAVASTVSGEEPLVRFVWNAAGVGGLLFAGLSAVHGMLYAARPARGRLGVYYLLVSVGGALGGVVAAAVAPRCFDSIAEYPLMLLAVALCLGAYLAKWIGWSGLGAVAAVLAWGRMVDVHSGDGRLVHRERGFYGLMSVREREMKSSRGDLAKIHTLFNGRISHGFQVMHPSLRNKPTMYYSLNGGGIAITNHGKWKSGEPMSVGMIGLGVGTLAAYGRDGDAYRFYEISPEDIAIATDAAMFSFVSDSRADVEIAEGDARLELAKDVRLGRRFDVLVVDAYCGDAVPMHLITKEAFGMYADSLAEGGVIALHLSNWHMNLWPVVKAAVRELGMKAYGTSSGAVLGEFAAATDWAFLTREDYAPRVPTCCKAVDWSRIDDIEMPTDDKGSLLPLLRFNFTIPTR